jgi:hypothetical protein
MVESSIFDRKQFHYINKRRLDLKISAAAISFCMKRASRWRKKDGQPIKLSNYAMLIYLTCTPNYDVSCYF